MFQSLKQKIAKETGQDITKLNYTKATTSSSVNNSARNSLSSNHSHSLDSSKDELRVIEEKDSEIAILRQELTIAQNKIKALEDEKKKLELSQELYHEEMDKIQNVQFHEIEKLKSLLVFREQESLDQLNKSKNDENQIEGLKNEIARIKNIEEVFENLQDEHENLRRSSQLEKNQLITKLSAKEEEIRHLTEKLEISEQRTQILNSSDTENDKIKLLLQERKMLESKLEETHIHLYEIKSNWTSQNLTLENQLSRLSRQVAEETAEKRKIVEMKDMLLEKNKQLEFDLLKLSEELKARDNKIKLMNEEIDELNSSLREALENEDEIEFLRSKVAYQENELSQTKESVLKISDSNEEYEKQILGLQRENNEKIEKLKSAESKIIELNERIINVEKENAIIGELRAQIDRFEAEIADKNKAIKILNQRLFDVKKTLQEEIKSKSCNSTGLMMNSQDPAILIPVNVNIDNNSNHQTLPFNVKKNSNNISEPIVFDGVKFSYLKHVIFKFLTTESKHLIKPVSTLLYLNDTEEKLLEEVLDYRKSWFGRAPSISMSAL